MKRSSGGILDNTKIHCLQPPARGPNAIQYIENSKIQDEKKYNGKFPNKRIEISYLKSSKIVMSE